ncbi:GNAT family N-acetyltransferase [Streptomyces sp. NPDC051020]|uniref:GNAT family N-acetyltransferase n=1 Tax=Streptomyces sp. NPDC051020 TaxID=3155409 RepID=UPI00341CE7F8
MTTGRSAGVNLRVGAEDAELSARLSEELTAFNNHATGAHDDRGLSVRVTDEAGDLVAGLVGWTWGGCAGISEVWVRADRRHEGWGARLVRAAEDEALARGCISVIVSSMSFQAPGFYRRQGYLETGSGGGLPGGHTRHHFFKELERTENVG